MNPKFTHICIILCLMVLCPFSGKAQNNNVFPYINDGDTYWNSLNGKIREVRRYWLVDSFGDYKKSRLSNVVKYNEDRSCIELFFYGTEQNVERKFVYRYNEKGNMLEASEYDANETLVEKTVYKYDDIRNIVDVSLYNSDGNLSEKCIIKHDGKGHKKEQSEFNNYGDIMCKYVFSYDGNGSPAVFSYDSKGKLNTKTVSKYNKSGRLVEEIQYKQDDKRSWRSEYKYDSKGNCVEKSNYDYMFEKSGTIVHMQELSRYDDRGNCVEKLYYTDDLLDNRELYEYDDYGNRTKEIFSRTEAEIFWQGSVYEYDYYESQEKTENE